MNFIMLHKNSMFKQLIILFLLSSSFIIRPMLKDAFIVTTSVGYGMALTALPYSSFMQNKAELL